MSLNIRKANTNEYRAITHLLASHKLPTSDINESNVELFVGLIDENIVATIGIEKHHSLGLLRSLCVKEDFKNQKLGDAMLSYILKLCAQENRETLYLLTTTAERYFEKYGFEKVARENVPEAIQQTREFQGICPLTAVVMNLKL